jgi:hypothetical protein
MKGTREFYQIQEQFEKDIKSVIYGHEIERVGRDEKVPSSVFYNDGYVNTLFQVYMLGHGNGKLTERVEE